MLGDESGATPLATVAEEESLTVVLPVAQAEELGLAVEAVFTCITLGVHSALDSVGLTATVSTALAERGLLCNVIAGYHHDHLLVPAHQAETALGLLEGLAQR
ncbi:ACT domain-containing protein [Tessaracoccus massiliensis]|uniref:ACT domain-containing protein n=1 Tax=Tessaracoccus massiliensis TaxID=1522311 RepID=UPI0011182322|nr:ACT domain-containing protein [Tessaracoccus massiliensis]